MRKNKSKPLLLVLLTGFLLLMPLWDAGVLETLEAAQASDSHDSKLSAFDIAPGVLSPAFSPDILEYTSTVDANVTSVQVQAVPRASGAVIASIEGRNGLHPGVNTIKATCSAQDNTFTVYTITLTVGSADAGSQQAGSEQPDVGGTQPAGSAEGTQQAGNTAPAGSAEGTQQAGNAAQPAGSAEGTQQAGNAAQPAGNAGGTQQAGDAGSGQQDTGNVGDAGGGQQDAGSAGQDATQQGAGTQTSKKKKKSVAAKLTGAVKEDGTVTLSGATYRLSSNFIYGATTQDIPSAFGQGSAQIAGNNYATLYCSSNGVHLVYMENTDGNGATGFYYYDEIKNKVERFKYAGTGDGFIVWISNARQEVPAGYDKEKSLKLPSGKAVASYQNLSSDELKDYYLLYGIHSDGRDGWYLYDNSQGTYLRYSNAFAAAQQEDDDGEDVEVERTVSLTKYNSLNEKYTELKESRVKIVSILIIAIVLIIMVFTALLLRSREEEDDDGEDDVRERAGKRKKPKKQAEAISKSSLAAGRNFEGNMNKNAKKVTKTFTQEPAEELPEKPAAHQERISSPEEIRAQVSRDQAMYGQESRIKKGNGQKLNGQRVQPASSPDTVQMAAERMRQSVKYPQKPPKAEPMEPEHDPMDDWDMEETARRKSQKASKASKASKKKRDRRDEDEMEIMDLNDL